MNKDVIRGITGLAILLILYLLIAFLIPFVKTNVFWASFVFTLIAFGVVAAAFHIAFMRNTDAKSRFYGFPIARIGAIYGAVQFAAGLLFMAIGPWVPVWLPVLLYAIALGAAVLGLIGTDTVVEQIQVQDVQLKKNVSFMRGLQSRLNQMAAQCDAPDAAIAVRKLAEELRYSDPVSSNALIDIERDLETAVDELQAAVAHGDTAAIQQQCRRASAVLNERNLLCKLNKA